MNKPIYIYTLSDPRTNTPRYVGKTFDMEKRLGGHCEGTQRTHTASWVKSLKKVGVKPIIEALEVKARMADAVRAAKTPEINAKISAALKGRKLSLEHRLKLSKAKRKQYENGWKMSDSHKAALAASLKNPEMIKRRGESIKRAWDRRKLEMEASK